MKRHRCVKRHKVIINVNKRGYYETITNISKHDKRWDCFQTDCKVCIGYFSVRSNSKFRSFVHSSVSKMHSHTATATMKRKKPIG